MAIIVQGIPEYSPPSLFFFFVKLYYTLYGGVIMSKAVFSIIMPCYNGLNYTVQAVESVLRQDVDFELICVDNASTDGTDGYLKSIQAQHDNVKLVLNEANRGVPGGLNDGMKLASGDYVVWLNNDIILPKDSLSLMRETLDVAGMALGLSKVGMVGPMMNFVGGRQLVEDAEYFPSDIDTFAEKFGKDNEGQIYHTGWLCGSCLMMTRKLVDDVGEVDERFFPGGYEDNDYCLRAQLLGYKLLIAGDLFVHHWGSVTFKRSEFEPQKWGTRHRDTYYAKWRDDKPKKLFAVYRVKDCADDLRRSLAQTEKFADGIVVWCDNCSDDTAQVAAECEKVVQIVQSDLSFDERRDRNAVINIAKEYEPDWLVSIDGDEVFEDKFDYDYAQRLMHPNNPETLSYGFHFYNFVLGETHWRSSGIFGDMKGFRMWRNLPEQFIVGGTSIGLHCGSTPPIAFENRRWTGIRIKHYAFASEEKAQVKYEWYQEIDEEKDEGFIGQNDYSHLISEEFSVTKWQENNDVSFYCLAKNGGQDLRVLLDSFSSVVDQIVVIDNESEDDTVDVAKEYGAEVYTWDEAFDFALVRNYAKSKCGGKWICTFDLDEIVDDDFIVEMRKLVEKDVDVYLFDVNNYHKQGGFSHSEAIRLYRNIPELVYRGLVHENFDQAVSEYKLKVVKPPHLIHHYGFLRESEDMSHKLDFYVELNKRQLAENPNDPKAMFNLALHYVNDGEYGKARELLLKAVELDEKYYHPRMQLAMLDMVDAKGQLVEALEYMNPQHRLYVQTDGILRFLMQVVGEEPIVVM